jgi:hypothetical protein
MEEKKCWRVQCQKPLPRNEPARYCGPCLEVFRKQRDRLTAGGVQRYKIRKAHAKVPHPEK